MSKSIVHSPSSMVKDCVFCFLSAVLLLISFPNFNFWILAWMGFVPLFFAIEGKSKGKAFLLAYITGVIFWLATIYWLTHVTFIGMFLLSLYLAVYFGIFGFLFSHYTLHITHYTLFSVPAIWVLLEYIRSHLLTGFGWALLGYSQSFNLPLIQIADITGVYGVSFLLMLVNVAMYKIFRQRKNLSPIYYIVPLILISIVLIYGFYRLNQKEAFAKQVKISVIQGNIPQDERMQEKLAPAIIQKHLDLSFEARQDKADLMIWPETAVPGILDYDQFVTKSLKSLVKDIKIPLLTGIITVESLSDNPNLIFLADYYNSAVLISPDARILNTYHKIHLVPFGEYIPLRKILPFLASLAPIGDFTAGKEFTVLKLPKGEAFSVLVCFEDVIPELSRQFVKHGARFLVNITNDAWFKKTSAPFQHLQASVFRAIENRKPLVRAANTGISCFINSNGEVTDYLEDGAKRKIYVEGFKTATINLDKCNSFYTRFGDVFVGLCAVVSMISFIILKRS